MTLKHLCLVLLVGASLTGSAACATVKPWQRGRLAHRAMQFDYDGGFTAFRGHWQESREGASGGMGLQGGGCGCK